MVLALVIPALLRLLQDDGPDETRPAGGRATVVLEQFGLLAIHDVRAVGEMPLNREHE